jgi:hypothetical protein
MKLFAHLPLPNGEVKIMFEGSFQDADFDSLNDYWKQILQSARGRARAEGQAGLMPMLPAQPSPFSPVDRQPANPTYKPVEPKVDWTE